ncbi:FAD-binding and (Fe-S)-binding domain-containing protein [Vineibacter terrae]|uniref:FAD-binding and (Fe-S)-binding domain-containing protein n=1 Tax=Vineibacter terrae TaxID=2586908 RepID=UPI002E378A16|nr:FAD-linked oxidase C-terminal domain-containing protein [Vineibacter terrae]HEX2890995.1 FAD-linked oxidase C-terminal domain-containing protein [Vineibacter terrae]
MIDTTVPTSKPATVPALTLERALRRELRGEVMFDAATRGRYSTDASIYQIDPVGVVVPRDEADLKTIVDVARGLAVPILARGAGTSQCGQTVGAALVIDCSKHLREIVSFDRDRAEVTVQPGLVLDHLNAWLKPHGLWYPVDVSTAAQCTLGGMAGNNSCGSRSIRYGNMVHNVAGIDAILADGSEVAFGRLDGSEPAAARRLGDAVRALADRERDEIERQVPKVLRRVGGYNLDIFHPQSELPYTTDNTVNLAHLLVGSEGTLAVTRRLTLKLAPLPRHKVLGVVNFPTFHKAMESAQHIVRLKPVTVELVDRTMIELARANPAFRPVIEDALIGAPDAILLVEFTGDTQDAPRRDLKKLVELMGDLGLPGSVVEMTDARRQSALWEVRKAGLNIMMSMKGDGKPVSFIEDCAVPLEHLADYTARLTDVFERHGTRGTWYAHASVGTLHVRPILDMRRDGAARMRAIAEEASALVRHYKGAYSGEHGDGLVRSEWVAWQFGPRLARAFEEIKGLFDPQDLLNPGKIVRPTRMDQRELFRYPPGYRGITLRTALDWSAWDVQNDPRTEALTAPGSGGDPAGGFGKAVEMCNNNGHCRKFDAGTMCPSYRATRDEQHLTRGRANTLRLALSGQLGAEAFTSQAMHETLDLCVSCKGCKRDCPTGVDMARMKIEFLHHYKARHGHTLKDRLIAHLPRYAHWGARLPWLFNLRDTLPGAAALSERMMGFSARRKLPTWRNDTFLGGLAFPIGSDGSSRPQCEGAAGEVVLFADTFNNAFEAENAHSALAVLEAAGYTVHVAVPEDAGRRFRPLCCGRTYLASGMVDEAKAEARRTLAALEPYAARGVPIVGLEPSCLLTLRDEYTVMSLGPASDRVAAGSFLLEEFLVREHKAGRLKLALRALPHKTALVHGHCHQKAFDAFAPVQTVLGWIPDLAVQPIESSCCGMAGAFGYEAAHHDVSMAMAELSLLPAVRSADAGTLIVADGTSCRHQIHDGAGRGALHVARVLAMALDQGR